MKDVDGVELKVGQRVVVFSGGRYPDFAMNEVTGFTPKKVRLQGGSVKEPRLVAVVVTQPNGVPAMCPHVPDGK